MIKWVTFQLSRCNEFKSSGTFFDYQVGHFWVDKHKMIRQPERGHLNRSTVKTLDQVFIVRAKEGLGCSQFGAEARTNLVAVPPR